MTNLTVFIAPTFALPDRGEGGIRRVVEAQIKHLPTFGIDVTHDIGEADLIAAHGQLRPRRKDVPFVSSCHGAYWANYAWGAWAADVNGMVRDAMLEADAITVPSLWVYRAITRSVLRTPTVIYHGIDAEDWVHNRHSQGYVLWNKARRDSVSDPREMQYLATLMPDIEFRTTMGEDTRNVRLLGAMTAEKMKPVIQKAGVYLATARETFGIGTLEALASGVPVAGWDYGGQSEIIIQGKTGWLAPYGDYDELANCVRKCIADRDTLSRNAVLDIRKRWRWEDKIEQYANLFKQTYGIATSIRPAVSVIVTSYNLSRYLPDCLQSVLGQSTNDWECIIVDDQSTDDTAKIAQEFCIRDGRFKYYKTPKQLKLSGALNYGFEKSTGKYIVNLDADNLLPPRALEIQVDALNNDPSIHIVAGDLDLINDDGSKRAEKQWHNKTDFDWRAQVAHIHQLHSSCMMRREVRIETGGYRERYWRAEDAHFLTLATSYGFRAKLVTDQSTMIYRIRPDSKSAIEYTANADKDGDWCADFPFRLASDAESGRKLLKETTGVPNAYTVPFSAQGVPSINNGLCWNVYHHEQPLVSVIIPVGPKHKQIVIDALDSLQSQDFLDWEAVIVNDTGEELTEIKGHPYVRIVSTKGKQGPSVARNLGIKEAKGKLITFLDADDYMIAGSTLRKMVEVYSNGQQNYIYTDFIHLKLDNQGTLFQLAEYNQSEWKEQHAVNILIARSTLLKVGGFDDKVEGWEEWDLFAKLAINGYCGRHLEIRGFVYRFWTGDQREQSFGKKDTVLTKFQERYSDYYDGVKTMAGCCPGPGDEIMAAKKSIEDAYQLQTETAGVFRVERQDTFKQTSGIQDKPVRMEFIGERKGGVTYFGNEGRQYVGGDNASDKYADVNAADVDKLEKSGHWKVIQVRAQLPPEVLISPVDELPTVRSTEPIVESTQAGMMGMFPTQDDIDRGIFDQAQKETEGSLSDTLASLASLPGVNGKAVKVKADKPKRKRKAKAKEVTE